MTDAQGSPLSPTCSVPRATSRIFKGASSTGFAGGSETPLTPRWWSRAPAHRPECRARRFFWMRPGPKDLTAEASPSSHGSRRWIPTCLCSRATTSAGSSRRCASSSELTDVPVPKMWWMESDPAPIGSQFFVMSRVEGEVPPDVMPYTFGDNWLFDSPPSKSRELQDASVSVLVQLHAIERPEEVFGFLAFDEQGASALERHVAHTKAWYDVRGRRRWTLETGRAMLRLA